MDRSGVVGSRWCSAVAAETTVGKAGAKTEGCFARTSRIPYWDVLTSRSVSAATSSYDLDESSLWEIMKSVRERKAVMRAGDFVRRA